MINILTSAPFGMQVFFLIAVTIVWFLTSTLIIYSIYLISKHLLRNSLDDRYLKLLVINYPLWWFIFMIIFFFLIRSTLVIVFKIDSDMSEFLGLIFGYIISTILTGILILNELTKKYHYKLNKLGRFVQIYVPVVIIPFLFPKVGDFIFQLITDILSTDFFPYPFL